MPTWLPTSKKLCKRRKPATTLASPISRSPHAAWSISADKSLLVLDPTGALRPLFKSANSFPSHDLRKRDFSLLSPTRDLLMDERVANPRRCRVLLRIREVHFIRTRPIDCRQAHWTRLTTRVYLAPGKLKTVQSGTRFADRNHLGMSG